METITTLQARMAHPAFVVPGAMDALQALGKATQRGGIPARTLELVHLRASQINGCGVCAVQHPRIAKQLGETDDRLLRRRRLARRAVLRRRRARGPGADRGDDAAEPTAPTRCPTTSGQQAARHYDEQALAALVLAIATINVWNRLNVATRQVAGQEW